MESKPENIPIPAAKRAKTLLGKFELDEVRDVSAGAATFYVWVSVKWLVVYSECTFFVWVSVKWLVVYSECTFYVWVSVKWLAVYSECTFYVWVSVK